MLAAVILSISLAGCGKEEISKLQTENQELKGKISALEQQVKKLSETPDSHFRTGAESLAAEKFDVAKAEFEIVINQFPTSTLTSDAKKQLATAEAEISKALAKKAAEDRRQRILEEKAVALRGEDVSYATFYTKAKMGMTVGKRYRFSSKLSQIPCLGEGSQLLCSINLEFDDEAEGARFYSSGGDYYGTIVASMGWGGNITVLALH
jgi:outer membrane murein-binding lipoprotein Lpp